MIDFDCKALQEPCAAFGFSLTDGACENLGRYGNWLLEWNEKMNLTAITEPNAVLWKHFYDCLLFFKYVSPAEGATVIDVGSGAGFPGMVLKIARPDLRITFLDSLNKRLTFLQAVLDGLSLTGEPVHLRAEEGGRDPRFREQYDIACARAVATLPVLCEYCLPFVKKGGLFVAMKGAGAAAETAAAEHAVSVLGGEKAVCHTETVPEVGERGFVLVKKISQTPTKYPRSGGKIAKSAL